MRIRDFLLDLFAHMAWADAMVWRSVLLRTEAEGDSPIRESLYHIHVVQHVYLKLWLELSPDPPEIDTFQELKSLAAWGEDFHNQVGPFLKNLDDAQMENLLVIPWTAQLEKHWGQKIQQASLVESMYQVVSHSSYHRGQVNTRIRKIGGEPPLTDFIAWIWRGKPSSEWLTSS